MAEQDGTTAPRWDSLHELLARAQQLGLHVQLNLHRVPTEELLDWLQAGLLDAIEKGATSNPPTGHMEAGDHLTGRTAVVAFMEDAGERQRRIVRQEDEQLESLRQELTGEAS